MTEHGQTTDEIRAAFTAGYELERELFGGGMSRVFLATERALGRRVVIKVLPPELAAGVNRERFRREVQVAAQLQHPHIVPLLSAGEQGELLYYTMPFIEGESLSHALAQKRRFMPREVVRILHDVVDALGYAHARGVIHRDIKPGNVLLSGSHAVVTDFGVAKAISAALPPAQMTRSGMVVGSPAYMAPEQLAGDPAADHRVDLYAVGLLAYELLTGETPFQASSPQETMAAQLTRTPEPLDKVRRDVPAALSSVIMRCLAKRPEGRPQSAAELLLALDAVGLGSGEHVAGGVGRRSLVVAGAAVVVLGALALWRQAREPAANGVVPRDTVTMSPAGPLLTRAESLAIAKAVDTRMAEHAAPRRNADSSAGGGAAGRAATSASTTLTRDDLKRIADSIRDEIQRAVFDSLSRVQQANADRGRPSGPGLLSPPPASQLGSRGSRGGRSDADRQVYVDRRDGASLPGRSIIGLAPELDSLLSVMEQTGRTVRIGSLDQSQFLKRAASLGPPRRIVVTEPRPNRSLADAAPYGAALAESIRRAAAGTKRFVPVRSDSVRTALEKTRTIDDLSHILNADVFASLSTIGAGPDSVIWQVTLRDLSAHGAYGTRIWTSPPTPRNGAIAEVDSVLARTTAQLTEMDRAPRRPPPDDAPGGPLSKEAFDARLASLGPPRRLIVWTHPRDVSQPALEAAGSEVTDSVRKALASNARYVVLGKDETLNALAKSRQREDVARTTRAELMVTIRGAVQRDSIRWAISAWDVAAHPAYEQRTLYAGRVPMSAPMANVDSLTRAVAAALTQLDRAPRRPATKE